MFLNHRIRITLLLAILFFGLNMVAIACDDTLVMLLTAQNPTSEFSKVIRSFTNTLTVLGTTLKNTKKDSYDEELNKVMDAWLEFSKRYMTNPPEEARNDLLWAKKTSDTARVIGEIRRLTSEKKYQEAHNLVLELSSRIGSFFEAFGVSNEKQLFIKTSTNLTNLERLLLQNDYPGATAVIADLRANLKDFKPMLPEVATGSDNNVAKLIREIETGITSGLKPEELDPKTQELKASFEELRSHILMKEWFPALKQNKLENK